MPLRRCGTLQNTSSRNKLSGRILQDTAKRSLHVCHIYEEWTWVVGQALWSKAVSGWTSRPQSQRATHWYVVIRHCLVVAGLDIRHRIWDKVLNGTQGLKAESQTLNGKHSWLGRFWSRSIWFQNQDVKAGDTSRNGGGSRTGLAHSTGWKLQFLPVCVAARAKVGRVTLCFSWSLDLFCTNLEMQFLPSTFTSTPWEEWQRIKVRLLMRH